jgi:hypothetical protein
MIAGLRPETLALFAKREAKILIRVLRILTQSAETTVSAGGMGAESTEKQVTQTFHKSLFKKVTGKIF